MNQDKRECEDCVSRDDVYGILMRTYFRDACSYEEFKERLEQIPPVDTLSKDYNTIYYVPQPKIGHWITKENGHAKCSKCLIVHPYPSIFCPSCGAKMVEPQESEGTDAL